VSQKAADIPGDSPSGGSSGVLTVAGQARRRILFADDEPGILEGLRSALRPQRREWETVFALGGPAALAEVKSRARGRWKSW